MEHAATISVPMGSEKHTLPLKFKQDLPIDDKQIRKREKERKKTCISLVGLSLIYPVVNVSDKSISYVTI